MHLHSHLVTKANDYLQKLPVDATKNDAKLAFDGLQQHTFSSEPYFWEQAYKMYFSPNPIPIDTDGKARVFSAVTNISSNTIPSIEENIENETSTNGTRKVKSWLCDPEMCATDDSLVCGVRSLLFSISSAQKIKIRHFYININTCCNPARSNRLGHALNCSLGSKCCCYFQATRILSCHFPLLRMLVSRVYEVRRICCMYNDVRTAMAEATFEDLKQATKSLQYVVQSNRKAMANDGGHVTRNSCSEVSLMERFRGVLRLVSTLRDTYNTNSCDVCEEFRKDLKPLKAYEHRKSFESEKMSLMIEQLYQNKTRHEGLDEFLSSTMICSYCADRLRSNKDVPRSVFNRLNVVDPPRCISDLNLFERTLIKFCITCVTMVRLGQISNTKRPQKELNSALKGRIAYLPKDVSANSSFLPDKILNFDSLVLMVGE